METNELKVKWSKKENDHLISFPKSSDGSLIHDYLFYDQYWFGGKSKKALIKELEERGYDLTTLKFSIKKKEQ